MAVALRPQADKGKMAKVPDDAPGSKPNVYDELLIAGADGGPRLYKMHRETKRVIGDDANKVKEFDKLPGRVASVQFNADGSKFAAVSSLDGKGEVRVYDTASGSKVVCQDAAAPAYAVAWSSDGKAIASAGFDGVVTLHDPGTGKRVKAFPAAPVGKDTAKAAAAK